MMTSVITVLEAVVPCRVCKAYTVSGGDLIKTSVASVSLATANTYTVGDAKAFCQLLRKATNSDREAIVAGGWIGGPGQFDVVTEAELARILGCEPAEVPGGIFELNGRRVAARLKRGFEPSQWILLDADDPEGMPPKWRGWPIEERLRCFEAILPGISACERVELRSSSARVSNNGVFGPPTHAYIRVSDPTKVELLRAYVQIEMVLRGLAFDSPRYSRIEPGRIIGHAKRTLFDTAVWVPGRLIFCAKPDVSGAPGYEVADAAVRIVNEGGGTLDIGWLEVPQPERLAAYRSKTGHRVELRAENGALMCTDYGQLTSDTEVEVRGETRRFADWLTRVPPDGKLRCETPFRASTSEAAFIGRHQDGTPFLYDVGTNTKYCMSAEAHDAVAGHELLLRAAQSVTPGDVGMAAEIARSAGKLGPAPRDQVLRQLNVSSGVGLGALRGEAQLQRPDQLALAMQVLERLGPGNLLRSESGFWTWQANGVWARCDDRWVKEKAQSTIAQAGQPVSSRLVDGVVEVLGNHVFSADHRFDFGGGDTVNCQNGELELIDGEWRLLPHRREQYRTTQIPVRYDPNATAPQFELFLASIFKGDADAADKRQAVLEMMGYSLVPHTRHERFAVLIGAGANGKSVLLGILEALCGPANTAGVQPSNFSKAFQRAHLQGKLVNIVTELAVGETLADAELKAIVSGELSTVEFKYKDAFTMRPFATCWFGTNHMPTTRDFSGALFRRALILEFNRVFSPNEQDRSLKSKLVAELPGILNLCLRAYVEAVSLGFTYPASSLAALKAWRLETDPVAHFIEENCTRDFGGEERFTDVYERYLIWVHRDGVGAPLSKKAFSGRLVGMGFARERRSDGVVVKGLWLKLPEGNWPGLG